MSQRERARAVDTAPNPSVPSRSEEANRSREEELEGALHDVGNALTVVLGWLDEVRTLAQTLATQELKAQGTESTARLRDALDVARKHTRIGHALARKAVAGNAGDVETSEQASALAHDAIRAVAPEASLRHVQLRLSCEGDDSWLENPTAVLQILINLLLNAVQFSPKGGLVELRQLAEAEHAVFRVKDQGPGISQALAKRLFEGPASERKAGAGIGLLHSSRLALELGGDLQLAEDGAGSKTESSVASGACFELLWPASAAAEFAEDRRSASLLRHPPPSVLHSEGETTKSPSDIAGMRVVVLEDDMAVLDLVRFGLESRGAQVAVAKSFSELQSLSSTTDSFDAALVDLSPVRADPKGMLQAIRGKHDQLPVILISGSAATELTDLPLSGWVHKPFELRELFDALARVRGIPQAS